MHDKHHYLDNYCSRESDADGAENLLEENVLQILPDFVLLKPWEFLEARDVIGRILVKTIRFAQRAENGALYVFNSSPMKNVRGRKGST